MQTNYAEEWIKAAQEAIGEQRFYSNIRPARIQLPLEEEENSYLADEGPFGLCPELQEGTKVSLFNCEECEDTYIHKDGYECGCIHRLG